MRSVGLQDVVHADLAAFNHVDESSRRGNEQMTAARQVLHLSTDVGAAVDDARTHVRPVRELQTHTHTYAGGVNHSVSLHDARIQMWQVTRYIQIYITPKIVKTNLRNWHKMI